MARTDYVNADGLKTHFGSSTKPYANNIAAAEYSPKKYFVVDFDYTTDTGSGYIPSGSVITDAWIFVDQAWTGLTDLTVGLVRADGTTAIDADGILSATLGAQANLTAGLVARADGALVPYQKVAGGGGDPANDPLIPAPSVLGYNGYIEAYANGTATAGSMRVVVEYIEPFIAVNV
jgi:hypothetical protein